MIWGAPEATGAATPHTPVHKPRGQAPWTSCECWRSGEAVGAGGRGTGQRDMGKLTSPVFNSQFAITLQKPHTLLLYSTAFPSNQIISTNNYHSDLYSHLYVVSLGKTTLIGNILIIVA